VHKKTANKKGKQQTQKENRREQRSSSLTFGEATKPRERRCKEQMERGNKKI
jgi:hypothetical protein